MSDLNILVVAPYHVFPTNSGSPIYMLSILKPVCQQVNLHLLAILNQDEQKEFGRNRDLLLPEYYKVFKTVQFCDKPQNLYDKKTQRSKLFHFMVHVFHGLPLMDISYYSPEVVRQARRIIERESIDLLEINQLHVAYIKKFFPKIPAILINHNNERDLYPFSPAGYPLTKKLFRGISQRNSYLVEAENAWKFDAMCYISQDEMNRSKSRYGKAYWLPPSIESDLHSEKDFNNKCFKVIYTGMFGWPPNAEGAIWFTKEILPLMRKQKNNIEFHFIGSNPPSELKKIHDGKQVFVHGYIEDISFFWKNADAFIVPLKSGGGIRIKIIEALNAGIPVITTAKGVEGLPCKPGRDLLVADDPTEFANMILKLADDKLLCQRLSANGKAYIHKYHNSEVIKKKKLEIYDFAVNHNNPVNETSHNSESGDEPADGIHSSYRD